MSRIKGNVHFLYGRHTQPNTNEYTKVLWWWLHRQKQKSQVLVDQMAWPTSNGSSMPAGVYGEKARRKMCTSRRTKRTKCASKGVYAKITRDTEKFSLSWRINKKLYFPLFYVLSPPIRWFICSDSQMFICLAFDSHSHSYAIAAVWYLGFLSTLPHSHFSRSFFLADRLFLFYLALASAVAGEDGSRNGRRE